MTMRTARGLAATLALAIGIAACTDGGGNAPPQAPSSPPPPPAAPPPSVEREINPSTTDPALAANQFDHFVINPNPSVTASHRLFVMLPGTFGAPIAYEEITRFGAARGYHTIGLSYVNDQAVNVICLASLDADCTEKVRREVITGQNTSPLVSVNVANSIEGRLRSLLTYLAATFPDEDWDRYLNAGQVDWSLVTVAGHSQGAGHSSFLAKLHDLNRVIMFSGGGDWGQTANSPAPWLSLPNLTPPVRQYGFIHTADGIVDPQQVFTNWGLLDLDMFGPTVSVDGASPPFGNSHQLVTSAPPNPLDVSPAATHGATVVDASTPLDAQGDPLFQSVWQYLAFP